MLSFLRSAESNIPTHHKVDEMRWLDGVAVAALLCPDCMKAGAVVFRCPQSRGVGVVVLRSQIFRIINVILLHAYTAPLWL